MKIFFICSGNSKSGISPIIINQGESLKKAGVEVEYFSVFGKGFKGYMNNIKPLRYYLKQNHYDIIHAHYSFSAILASLAGAKPLIVSLMGSDVKSSKRMKFVIGLFHRFFWDKIIVKSEDMKIGLWNKEVYVIPNGVDLQIFQPLNQLTCKIILGWDTNKKQILFAANPNRFEKNFSLASKAFDLLADDDIELHYLDNVPNSQMPVYFNAANVVILTSLWEGSPNVIKEAMACNIPIVSTDVGNVKWLFGKEDGHFLTTFDPVKTAENLAEALAFSEKYSRTNGRKRLIELGLSSDIVAQKLISIYNSLL